MALKLMGKKSGMTQRFDEAGNIVVCTIIHAEPNVVVQVKKKESDGYDAIQLGFDKIQVKDPRTIQNRMTNQLIGHFKKANVEPRRYLTESRVEDVDSFVVGQELGVSVFAEVGFVDVTGISKGKGYQGVMKRYGHAGGPGAHGSGFHRHGGSTGMRTEPGRTHPLMKKAGRMGGKNRTVQNLRVVGVDEQRNALIVEGAIPGPVGGLVYLTTAMKKKKKNKKTK